MSFDREQATTEPTESERTWAMLAHLGGPIGSLFSVFLLGFVAPLVVYLARRDDSPFVADQAKEALDWQITLLLLHVGGFLAIFLTLGLGILIVGPIFIALWILELVLGIVGGLQAYSGRRYRYPFTLRFLR